MLWANQKKTCVKENEDLRPIENLPTRAGETKARGWNGEWIDVIVNDPEAIWPVQAPAATRVTAAISNEPISIHELHLLGNIVISIISNIQRSTSDIQVGVCVAHVFHLIFPLVAPPLSVPFIIRVKPLRFSVRGLGNFSLV